MSKCLQSLRIPNPKYRTSLIPFLQVYDDAFIWVPCGKCFNCRKTRASNWRSRLIHEISLGKHKRAHFVTFTISPEHYAFCSNNPSRCIRLFLERYRKRYGKSLRHWFVTELGENSGRFHFHGIIFDYPDSFKQLHHLWSYGHIWVGSRCNEATASYIVKYITKPSEWDEDFVSQVFCSPGIGRCYALRPDSLRFHNSTSEGVFYLRFSSCRASIPRYYLPYLFSRDQLIDARVRSRFTPPPLTYRGVTYNSVSDLDRVLAAELVERRRLQILKSKLKSNTINHG